MSEARIRIKISCRFSNDENKRVSLFLIISRMLYHCATLSTMAVDSSQTTANYNCKNIYETEHRISANQINFIFGSCLT
jgi:hypothetical protein